METLKVIFIFVFTGFFVISCQKETTTPVQKTQESDAEFTVPEIPDEIAIYMSDEDKALFRAGPGEEFLQDPTLKSFHLRKGQWHPVLMKLGYHLQFWPVCSCEPGNVVPFLNPDGSPTGACDLPGGSAGITYADGYWFSKPVHAEYYPVFCAPDYDGYGTGFYQHKDSKLFLEAVNDPFHYDEEGNFTFLRKGHYVPGKSTGEFENSVGWEYTIIYTADENNPAKDPLGQGYSVSVTFGWVCF